MRTPFLLLGFLCIMAACSESKVEVPSNVIPRDTMIAILADVHLAEANIQVLSLGRSDSTKEEAYGLYRFILSKYRINDEKLRRSFEFYRSEPEYFHEMYNEVLTRLSEKQATVH